MLAFQHITGQLVIETFRVPFNQRKIFPVVVGVATRALLARSRLDVVGRMQPFVRGDAVGNFRMTFQALECSFASELMAGGAIGRSG